MSHFQKSFGLMGYFGWSNMGDAMQTVALSRLLPGELAVRFRDNLKTQGVDSQRQWVINGFFHSDFDQALKGRGDRFIPNPDCENVLYAGIHLAKCGEGLRSCSFPIGARDSYTKRILDIRGVSCELSGCATLTLPKYEGPRSGILHIEDFTPHCKSQEIPYQTSWPQQWEWAIKRLGQMRTAEEVITTRLHVALPCLAFGTPVKVPWLAFTKINDPTRMTALDDLGFEYDKFNQIEITQFADRYKQFLYSRLKIEQPDLPDFTALPCPLPV